MKPNSLHPTPWRALSNQAARAVLLLCLVGLCGTAHAYPGEQLLVFSANFIIAPLGLISIVLFLAASIFRPDAARMAVYAAAVCAVLFFIIKSAPQLMVALKA